MSRFLELRDADYSEPASGRPECFAGDGLVAIETAAVSQFSIWVVDKPIIQAWSPSKLRSTSVFRGNPVKA
jgi:hypothetical protein